MWWRISLGPKPMQRMSFGPANHQRSNTNKPKAKAFGIEDDNGKVMLKDPVSDWFSWKAEYRYIGQFHRTHTGETYYVYLHRERDDCCRFTRYQNGRVSDSREYRHTKISKLDVGVWCEEVFNGFHKVLKEYSSDPSVSPNARV